MPKGAPVCPDCGAFFTFCRSPFEIPLHLLHWAMAKSPMPLLLIGAAFLLMKSKKGSGTTTPEVKPGPTPETATTDDGSVLGGTDLSPADAAKAEKILLEQGKPLDFLDTLLMVPPLQGGNEVVFNLPRTEFAMGPAWRYVTLDKWLNEQRLAGWLETKTDEATTFIDETEGESVDQILSDTWDGVATVLNPAIFAVDSLLILSLMAAAGIFVSVPVGTAMTATAAVWGLAWSAAAIGEEQSEEKVERMKKTSALVLKEFMGTHTVLVGSKRNPVLIKDLGINEATIDFVSVIANYIVRFQASSYS